MQTQRLALNQSLQASIGLLRIDAAGLTRYLEEQSATNPYLKLQAPPPPALHEWLPRWSPYLTQSTGNNDNAVETAPDVAPSLNAHASTFINQLALGAREQMIAFYLLEVLEPSGWLGQSTAQVAQTAQATRAEVDLVLAKLQKIDPPGLFARDLAECLRLQLIDLGCFDKGFHLILQNLNLLASGDIKKLSSACALTEPEIAAKFRVIRGLNPKPGADFMPMGAANIREPDLMARQETTGNWVVSLNHSLLPSVQIDPNAHGSTEDLAMAKSIKTMVIARNSTLLRVAGEIIRVQTEALTTGAIGLVPMSMAQIANLVGLSESTVSRAVAGASLDTPTGTWWLRDLFSQAIGENGQPVISSIALCSHLARMIQQEDPANPHADQDLVNLIYAKLGITVARRTVANYRKAQGIPIRGRRKRRGLPKHLPRSN